jgi:hypothetical protein
MHYISDDRSPNLRTGIRTVDGTFIRTVDGIFIRTVDGTFIHHATFYVLSGVAEDLDLLECDAMSLED